MFISTSSQKAMRTTLNLDDDAFRAASHYAAARAMKLGDAVSELVQRGLKRATAPSIPIKKAHGIAIFQVPKQASTPVATAELVKRLVDD
jgi:hypothetical protein